jgi:hypothetical protein
VYRPLDTLGGPGFGGGSVDCSECGHVDPIEDAVAALAGARTAQRHVVGIEATVRLVTSGPAPLGVVAEVAELVEPDAEVPAEDAVDRERIGGLRVAEAAPKPPGVTSGFEPSARKKLTPSAPVDTNVGIV